MNVGADTQSVSPHRLKGEQMSYISKYDIVRLWYETQMGDMKKCREKQIEFSEIMWKLYNKGKDNVVTD